MVEFSIRCHPSVPLSAEEIGDWLERLLVELRTTAPRATTKLSRLTQELPTTEVDVGWLVELAVTGEEFESVRDVLADVLRDMRLVGLQPTLLAPVEMCEWPAQGRDGDAGFARPQFGNAAAEQ
jgi:hypothetical protein